MPYCMTCDKEVDEVNKYGICKECMKNPAIEARYIPLSDVDCEG